MVALSASPIGTFTTVKGRDHQHKIDYEVPAFIPDPLPEEVHFDTQTWLGLNEARGELGRLDAAATMLPNPMLINRIATRHEAIGTSALEGTYANLTQILAAEASEEEPSGTHSPEILEILNYTATADLAFSWVSEREVSVDFLVNLQARLMAGIAKEPHKNGKLRDEQVFVGSRSRPITEARFVPPPPGPQLRALLDQIPAWVNDTTAAAGISPVAKVAMVHYQFECIHPFYDGNGRIGRLLAVLQLLRQELLSEPVLSVSPWLNNRSDEYRDQMLAVSQTGDWDPWVEFFARAIRDQSANARSRIQRLLAHRERTVDFVRSKNPRGGLAVQIAEGLIGYPILSVRHSETLYGRTNQSNRNAIERLVDLGVIEPFTDSSYRRLYWAPEIFQIIEGET